MNNYLKKTLFMLCLLLIKVGMSRAQVLALKKVNVGEPVPAYSLKNMINYPGTTANLTDFKTKVLILDFWSFGCASCVESWPKLIKLQEKFKDKLQFITINNRENPEKIQAFIKKQEKMHGYQMTLPVSCSDPFIATLFPYTFVPHAVFIDQQGVVRYITSGSNINEETIQNMISAKEMALDEKTDSYTNINWSKPLFLPGSTLKKDNGDQVVYSSVITPYSNEIWGIYMGGTVKKTGVSFGFIGNYPVKSMLRVLYAKIPDFNTNLSLRLSRILFEGVDSTKLVGVVNGIFKNENRYTIQVTSKRKLPLQTIRKKMISDIENYWGIKTGWEMRKRDCLVISRSDAPLKMYKYGDSINEISKISFQVNKITVPDLIYGLGNVFFYMSYPIIDESNYDGKLGEIKFDAPLGNLSDYRVLGRALEKYGLKFSVQQRDTEMLIITPADEN